jgi:hypothetical protein
MRFVVTYERISILPTKETKKLNFIYGTTIRTKQIWNNFSASPDLERSLTKTKKELRQTPITTHSLARGLEEQGTIRRSKYLLVK